MHFFDRVRPMSFLVSGLVLMLALAIACGSAAPPDVQPADTSGAQQPTAAPVVVDAPTPVPQAVDEPAEVQVHPGKLTWMVGGWGSERFDYTFDVGGSNNYIRFLGGFLLETNAETELVPGIASEWGVSDDGLTWTVTVRDGVKFHDGSDLTAEDVRWTWCHQWCPEAKDYATQSGAQSRSRYMDKVEQIGPDQVSLTTTTADGAVPAEWWSSATAGPWVVLPEREEQHDEAAVVAYSKDPIGAGPMRLLRHVPAEVMEFERFDDYYFQPANGFSEDRRVKFTLLDLLLVPEQATRVAAIRAGEADIAPASLQAKNQVEAGGGRLVFGPEGVYIYIRMLGCWDRPDRPLPCDDRRVRQALAYAFDRELLRDQLFGGPEVFQVKGWTNVTPSTIGYSPELDPYPFDPDKARQLLADAGYPNGEGFGKLIVNTWESTATPFVPESAQLIADFWRRELGIDAEVRVGDESDLKKATLTEEIHGQVIVRDNETRLEAARSQLGSYGTPDHKGRYHDNPELMQQMRDAAAVFDPAERDIALNKIYKRLSEENYGISVGYANIPWAVGPRVVEWQPWPLAFYPSNIHGITLEQP